MNLVLINVSTVMMLICLISIMLVILSKKSVIDLQKSSPFECGFNTMSYSRLPFSIHFFLIAVLFLIFDIEIIIIIPMIMLMKSTKLLFWLFTSLIFVFILIIGLYHEWYNGMLNWTN
uniref:NADH dehydrogenase subunit 3 n=1 Tax=Apphia rufipenna TaxID=3040695 RepID=UPI002551ECAA|nr:NADH dehydrogenase subunit 3 [Apphia rufipenna]WGC89423.1 NADH dehydrogenase subunit 3 [Apphia rufipenna]